MDMCRNWEGEKEGNWVLEEENSCGMLSLTAESVCVVTADRKDTMEWILVRKQTHKMLYKEQLGTVSLISFSFKIISIYLRVIFLFVCFLFL